MGKISTLLGEQGLDHGGEAGYANTSAFTSADEFLAMILATQDKVARAIFEPGSSGF